MSGLAILLYCAVHVAAWNYECSTGGEHVAWRVTAGFSTVAPSLLMATKLALLQRKDYKSVRNYKSMM